VFHRDRGRPPGLGGVDGEAERPLIGSQRTLIRGNVGGMEAASLPLLSPNGSTAKPRRANRSAQASTGSSADMDGSIAQGSG
jgi:hypothetical protein